MDKIFCVSDSKGLSDCNFMSVNAFLKNHPGYEVKKIIPINETTVIVSVSTN